VKVWRFRSDGLAADHGDADAGHKVWRDTLPTVRPQVRGGGGGVEPPHPKAHTILL
jgi:hypothetical protein